MASFLKASCASKRTKTAHEHFEAEDDGPGLLTDSEMLRKLVADVTQLRNEMRSRVLQAEAQELAPTAETVQAIGKGFEA